jgi:hypothetical protein
MLSPATKEPCWKKSSFTLMIPFQNRVFVGLTCTCKRVFPSRYLLCNNSYHTPSSERSLNSHFPSKHLLIWDHCGLASLPRGSGENLADAPTPPSPHLPATSRGSRRENPLRAEGGGGISSPSATGSGGAPPPCVAGSPA